MAKYNILAKRQKGREYIILDMIATKLSEKAFKRIQEQNKSRLGDYVFIKNKDTDFSWWDKVSRKLTPKYLKEAEFECDVWGNVKEVDYSC